MFVRLSSGHPNFYRDGKGDSFLGRDAQVMPVWVWICYLTII